MNCWSRCYWLFPHFTSTSWGLGDAYRHPATPRLQKILENFDYPITLEKLKFYFEFFHSEFTSESAFSIEIKIKNAKVAKNFLHFFVLFSKFFLKYTNVLWMANYVCKQSLSGPISIRFRYVLKFLLFS